MAIGFPITQGTINARAGTLATRLRDLAADTENFATAVGALSLTGLGFSAPDAAAMNTAVAKMQTLWSIYTGGIAPGSADNYDADLAALRGLNT